MPAKNAPEPKGPFTVKVRWRTGGPWIVTPEDHVPNLRLAGVRARAVQRTGQAAEVGVFALDGTRVPEEDWFGGQDPPAG